MFLWSSKFIQILSNGMLILQREMLRPELEQMLGWDAFDAVLAPGDPMLLISWKSQSYAQEFEKAVKLPLNENIRRVRVVRDFGMFDRREAPRYYSGAVCATE